MVFHGQGRLAGDVYTAGATLVPVGVFALGGSLLGAANVELALLLALFAWTYVVLILYAGCSRIARVTDASAAPAVPLMLVASGYLTKVVVAALL
jgi:hypothetical protein